MISDYAKDAKYAKKMLATRSPSFCLAKWFQTSLHLTTGHTNSCYHPPLHKINEVEILTSPDKLHNTQQKFNERAQMNNGERPVGCSYCWNIEDTGEMSDRFYRSGEPWAMNRFNETKVLSVNPSYVEVNFNYACNLKCSYCSPQFSSSWEKEIRDKGPYPTQILHNVSIPDRRPIPNKDYNPYVSAFWKWWPGLYPDLKHFRLTGGEPLMDKNTYKVFDYILENPKKDLHLDVTSNFSPDDPKLMDKYIDYVKRLCEGEKIEHFMQFVSVDTWGKQAEYIRYGLNFEYLLENIDRYLTEVPGRNSLTLIMTQSNLALPGMRSLLEEVLKLRKNHSHDYQRVWFDTPILRAPVWQSITLLPKHYQTIYNNNIEWMKSQPMADDSFVGFKDYEIQKITRILTFWQNSVTIDNNKKADFYRFFREHDKRRSTNFLKTFPEFKEFWWSCQHLARKTK